MELDNNGLSVQCYLKPRIVGKIRRRLQEMRSLSPQLSTVDLSHNEAARLATDALLDHGLKAYQDVLVKEEEADFLSTEEKSYILGNVKDPVKIDTFEVKDGDVSDSSSECSSQTYFPMVSESEPPGLDFGWPVADWSYHLQGVPSVEVYFQSHKSVSIKDLLREFIRKATTVLAIVMDTFSDVEIFCDILEATKKRNVFVYLLLDHINLQVFKEMFANLQINKSHLTHLSVRSIGGETYCSKSGRKLTGQVKEKFMIVDCTHVLAGAYSFTWLSWQVDRNITMLFKGASVKAFDIEFRRLYAASKPIPDFYTVEPEELSPFPRFMEQPFQQCLNLANANANANWLPETNVSHYLQLQNQSSPRLHTVSSLSSQQFLKARTLTSLWLPQRIHRPTVSQRFTPRNFSIGNPPWHLLNNHLHQVHGGLPLTQRILPTRFNTAVLGEHH